MGNDLESRYPPPFADHFGIFSRDESQERFQMLMGKGEAAARRNWMEEHGNEAEADI